MRTTPRSIMLTLLLFTAILPIAQTSFADEVTTTVVPGTTDSGTDDTMQSLATYLFNLGGDLGYNLNNAVKSPKSALLVNPPAAMQSISMASLMTFFGAIPVNASLLDLSLVNFVPSNNASYTTLNTLANTTFMSYNSPGSNSTTGSAVPVAVTASPLVDQQTFQQDPVNQAILNIVGTPDATWCMDPTDTTWLNNNSQTVGDCKYLYNYKIMNNVIGNLPATPFVTRDTPAPFLSELNSNSLIAPLLYTTTNSSASATSTTTGNTGLTASNQAQQAANFIRYATGSVIPLATPSQVDYNNLLMQVYSSSSDRKTKEAAQATLDNYLASIRVYAAKNSVAISNLYYILSKRLPQTQSQSDNTVNGTSQALMEMTMATKRMYDPAAAVTGTPQWITQINYASPATVQKEMAILLAEINYQLYLNRQQDERLLLTNSLLLLQMMAQSAPEAKLQTVNTSSSSSSEE